MRGFIKLSVNHNNGEKTKRRRVIRVPIMPLSMKIQPIDAGNRQPGVVKPVVKSRLRRLFRISAADKDEPPTSLAIASSPATEVFEPSSVCLAKMVQNFIEESNEKQSPANRCGRNRCNCFNGNGSDSSDGESPENVTTSDVCEFLKNLMVCTSVNERKVMAETAKIVMEKNKKGCKRKDELRKMVSEGLVCVGFDSALCKSKWDKSSSFPAGEYEYVDVIIGGERLIIDIDFRSEFEVARSTKTYKSILQTLPNIYVGKSDRLSKIIGILSEAAKQSLKKKGMHIPPWRKAEYIHAKWLSPPTRLTPAAPSLPSSAHSVIDSDGPSPDKTGADGLQDECDSNPSPAPFEAVFEMSESSGEEDVKVKVKKKDQKNITGLASIMEEKHKP